MLRKVTSRPNKFGQFKTSEFKTIQSAIKSTKNRNDAAKVLGISPRTLRYKLAQFKNLETQQYSFE